MIKFNEPLLVGNELKGIEEVIKNNRFSGDGPYSRLASDLIQKITGSEKAYLLPSGTHALEMSALLSEIMPGDEVIMPSFTFSSTANAFLLRGAKIKFVDVRPDTLNINEKLIEDAITEKTKVIVPVHYAGVSCEMDKIMKISKEYGIIVVEDAAQGIFASYNGKPLGSIGDFGCLSFHETKNIQCGEGGSLLLNDPNYLSRADIIMEKGTDRKKFMRGEVDKYTWQDSGSSFLMNEITASFLYSQLLDGEKVIKDRINLWNLYFRNLTDLNGIDLPSIPTHCQHNGHIFHIRLKDSKTRDRLQKYLYDKGIQTATHYVPLHSSPYGSKVSAFRGEDRFTTRESSRLLRLPLHNRLSEIDVTYVTDHIKFFMKGNA